MADEDTRSEQEQEQEQADLDQQMKELEENPPDKLEDWPGGKAKYRTFGGSEQDSGYEDGPTSKLGPSELRHHDDGSVTIGGEKVDDPDQYKGEPIPGGPTDPDAPDDFGTTKTPPGRQALEEKQGEEKDDD